MEAIAAPRASVLIGPPRRKFAGLRMRPSSLTRLPKSTSLDKNLTLTTSLESVYAVYGKMATEMSEVRLNLIDNERILQGTIHGSVVDLSVAALSADPETIAELDAALSRYCRAFSSETIPTSAINQSHAFPWLREVSEI